MDVISYPSQGTVLITGGAGFIGTNLARAALQAGWSVLVLDNLSRPGVERNLAWLRCTYGDRVQCLVEDVRDPAAVRRAIERADGGDRGPLAGVFHLAAQVAVTSSLTAPLDDFEVNVRGTLNVLEALRTLPAPLPLLFTSTNKVYGELRGLVLARAGRRYVPIEPEVAQRGIGEEQPLDFRSPYGCSKGAADQYVLEYARTYGIPAVVFRMSCIYGPFQYGTEDQGWIAHFLIAAMTGRPITIYGDGCQVRDALFVEDLVRAMLLVRDRLSTAPASPGPWGYAGTRVPASSEPADGGPIAGRAFNIGGGPAQTLSLLELIELAGELLPAGTPAYALADWRPGDQRYYVSDTRAFSVATGWLPRVGVREGLGRLYRWLCTTQPQALAATAPRPVEAVAASVARRL